MRLTFSRHDKAPCQQALAAAKPVYTLPSPHNAHLITLGAQPSPQTSNPPSYPPSPPRAPILNIPQIPLQTTPAARHRSPSPKSKESSPKSVAKAEPVLYTHKTVEQTPISSRLQLV